MDLHEGLILIISVTSDSVTKADIFNGSSEATNRMFVKKIVLFCPLTMFHESIFLMAPNILLFQFSDP